MGFTDHTQLTNLRFADVILLFANTLRQLKTMLKDIKRAAAKVGLEMHPEKTKILSNATKGTGRPKETQVLIDGMDIEIVPYSGSVKYLGRMVGFDRPHDVEIHSRIRNAWKCFMQQRAELTDRKYSLNSRLRLFDCTVSTTMLYGSATWVLTRELEDHIRRTQRKMLRMVVRTAWRKERKESTSTSSSTLSGASSSSSSTSSSCILEPWPDVIQRATHAADHLMAALGLRDWVAEHRKSAVQWSSRMRTEQPSWAQIAFGWEPFDCTRRPEGPRRRWADAVHACKMD